MKNLAKLISRLRRKIRNMEIRYKNNACSILSSLVDKTVKKIKKSNIDESEKTSFNIDNLVKSIKKLREYPSFEYEDQKFVIENFIDLIAEDKINLDSINFKKLCTQIRMFLDVEKVKYISTKGQKIIFSMNEMDIHITPQEYEFYSKFKNNRDAIRAILGVETENNKEYPEKITFEEDTKKEKSPTSSKFSPQAFSSGKIDKPPNSESNSGQVLKEENDLYNRLISMLPHMANTNQNQNNNINLNFDFLNPMNMNRAYSNNLMNDNSNSAVLNLLYSNLLGKRF